MARPKATTTHTTAHVRAHRLICLQDAAGLLAVSPDTIRRRIADGALPAYRVGRQLRVRAADVERLAVPLTTVGAL